MTAIIRTKFPEAETYMQSCMTDSAHDREHVYRVLNCALGIARHEGGVGDGHGEKPRFWVDFGGGM
jgi:uncharacterized protein